MLVDLIHEFWDLGFGRGSRFSFLYCDLFFIHRFFLEAVILVAR